VDIKIQNKKFTWWRSNSASKIDRFLVTHDWLVQFQNLNARCREKLAIILNTEAEDSGPKPFRSLNCWLTHPGFKKLVQTEWHNLQMGSTDQKLTALKTPIKEWKKNVFGDIEEKLTSIQFELKKLDAFGSANDLNEMQLARRRALEAHQWLWLGRKERLWRQLSRCKNLKEGDRSTKYFHAKASIRRNTNSISCLLVNGRTITNLADIKRNIVRFYKTLYSSQGPISVDLSFLNLQVLFDVHR